MTEAIRGSVDFLPIPHYQRIQGELAWGFSTALGEMGSPSNMGAIISMIEGSRGFSEAPDLVEDPWAALEAVLESSSIRAAGRYRTFCEAIRYAGPHHAAILQAVYWRRTGDTEWEAFKGAANLVPLSEVAKAHHHRSRTTLEFIPWLAKLADRLAGAKYRHPQIHGKFLRHPPKATDEEKRAGAEIKDDVEEILTASVKVYARGEAMSLSRSIRKKVVDEEF